MDAFGIKKSEIKGGFYLLEGNDAFLLKETENLFRALLPSDSLSLYVIDKIYDLNEIFSCVGTYNFDGTPNIVIVRDEDVKLDETAHAKLADFLTTDISPDCVVFRNAGFLTASEKKSMTVINCSAPDKFKCVTYIERSFPCGIERSAAELLADYTENNLAKINNEKIKLVSYCGEKRVTRQDVEDLVAEDREVQVFAFANSIVNKNRVQAMKHLEKMRVSGIANAAILSSLSGQFQRMLYCAISPLGDEDLAKLMKIKPFAVKKAREIRGFNQTQLKNTLSLLLSLELQFKSGVMSDETALNLAVSKLLD